MKNMVARFVVAVLTAFALTVPVHAADLNSRGQVVAGVGSFGVTIDKVPVPGAGQAQGAASGGWFNDDTALVQVCDANPCTLALYDQRTGVLSRILGTRGGNDVRGKGGVWAAWLAAPGVGLYASTGLHLPEAGLLDVGPTGEIAYVPVRQDGTGVNVREKDGTDWRLTDGAFIEVRMLGQRRAIAQTFQAGAVAFGLPQPRLLPGGQWMPRAVEVQGQWWIGYFNANLGYVLHPWNSFDGWVIAPPGVDAFGPTLAALNGTIIRTASATHAGETAADIRVIDHNTVGEARVNLEALIKPVEPTQPKPTEPQPKPEEPKPTEPTADCGRIPDVGQQALRTLWNVPQINALVRGNDDQRREAATVYFAPQLAFTLGPQWGTKRADPGRPLSKDAMSTTVNGTLCAWDIVNGTTRELNFGEGEPIPGQVFVTVTAKNWLAQFGGTQPDPTEPEPNPGDSEELARLREQVIDLEGKVATLNEEKINTLGILATVQNELNEAQRQLRSVGCQTNGAGWIRSLFGIGCVPTLDGMPVVR